MPSNEKKGRREMQDYVMDGSRMIPADRLKADCEEQDRARGCEVDAKKYKWTQFGMLQDAGTDSLSIYCGDRPISDDEWVRAEDYDASKKRVDSLLLVRDALEDETERLREECAQRRLDCKQIRREMQEENERLEAENKKLKSELGKWTAPHPYADLRFMAYQADQPSLTAKQAYINALETSLKRNQAELAECRADKEEIEAENVRLVAGGVELKAENERLKAIVSTRDKELSKAYVLLKDRESECEKAEADNKLLKAELAECRKERDRAIEEARAVQSALKKAGAELIEMDRKLELCRN